MRNNVFIKTGNVKEFFSVAEKLKRVEAGVPGMGLVHGVKGLGKTTVAIHYASQKNHQAVYVRGKRDWTYTWMMEEMLIELEVTPRRGEKAKFDDMVSALVEKPRLIIVDESNMIKNSLLETLRSVHDMTHNPILFIGHEGIRDSLLRMGPFYDRLLYKSELKPLSLTDLGEFCAEALEVGIEEQAVGAVLKSANGNFRKSVVVLKELENKAKALGRTAIDVSFLSGVVNG